MFMVVQAMIISQEMETGNILKGGAGDDIIKGIAGLNLLYGEDGADIITGGTGDDSIDGGADNDIIYANAGNNIIYGGAGTDTIFSGSGNDIIYGGTATDVGTEQDWVSFESALANVTVNLNQATAGTLQELLDMLEVVATGLDSLFGIENIIASANDDNITLNDTTVNTVYGGAGSDTIKVGTTCICRW